MKGLFLIFFFTPAVLYLHAQKVNFEWAKQMGGTGLVDARGLSIVTDATGNVYTTGYFKGRVDFDPGQGIYNLDPIGIEDLYISKLDPSGKFLWAKQMDISVNPISATGKAIAVDASGNVFVTGDFTEVLGGKICFVSKLDPAGNFLWTKQLGVSSTGTSIKVDAFGNVYTAGLFTGQIDFDPGPGVFYVGSLTNFASSCFVYKLDAGGNFVWAKEITGYQVPGAIYGSINNAVSLALDGPQNIHISGSFGGTVDFDPGPAFYNLTNGGQGIFVLKLDGYGNFSWVKQMGGMDDIAISISADSLGNIYTAGNFTGTSDFDPGPGVFNLISANGIFNTFISKLDKSGNLIWAKQLVGGSQWCYSAMLDNNANLYATGYFRNTVDFDPGPGTYNLSTSGFNVFVSKLNANGDFVWAKQMGGTANIITNSIVVDIPGNVYTTGYFFNGQVDFDPGPGTYYLTAGNGENAFVHKMSQCLNNASSAITASACKNYTLNGQTYTSSGVYTQTLTSAAGCDSIITLTLTIKTINKVISVAACTNFTLNNHTYGTSGIYTDTLITANGCDSIITLHLTITPPLFTSVVQSICAGQSFNGHTVAGTYIDTLVANNGCDSIVTLQLTLLPKPTPYLGVDTSLCPGDSLLLFPGKFTTYTWQDGSAQEHLTIKKPGLYSVVVTDNCGSATDEIIITDGICGIYFPKAFSPNNDGINDLFKILRPNNLREYHLSVYNRTGQKVFETFDYSKGWDGSFNGQLQSVQTFVWYCEFKKQSNANRTMMKGKVTLIR